MSADSVGSQLLRAMIGSTLTIWNTKVSSKSYNITALCAFHGAGSFLLRDSPIPTSLAYRRP